MSSTTRALAALCTASVLTSGLVLASTAAGASTRPATSVAHHVAVSLPSQATIHRSRAPISARTAVLSGTHERVTGSLVTAFSHGDRVAQGHTVRLRPGRYTVTATVAYRTYRVVTRHRTRIVRTVHKGGYPAAKCTITALDSSRDDGVFDIIRHATCSAAGFPGRTSIVIGEDLSDYPQDNGTSNYHLGQVLPTRQVYFDGYRTTSKRVVTSRVTKTSAVRHFTTPRGNLVVIGHR